MRDDTRRSIARALTDPSGEPGVAAALADLPEPDTWSAVRGEGYATVVLGAGAVEWILDAEPALDGGIDLRRSSRER